MEYYARLLGSLTIAHLSHYIYTLIEPSTVGFHTIAHRHALAPMRTQKLSAELLVVSNSGAIKFVTYGIKV